MTSDLKGQGLTLMQGGGVAPPERAWVLVATNAKAEKLAAFHLRRLALPVYLPLRAWKSKRTDAGGSTPLFPGYVFVQVTVEGAPWALMRTAIGVHDLPQSAGRICRVPDALVTRLQGRELFGLVSLDDDRPRSSGPRFSKGERLRIAAGQFEGFDVVFDAHLPDSERVWVLLQFCGGERRAQVDASALKKGA